MSCHDFSKFLHHNLVGLRLVWATNTKVLGSALGAAYEPGIPDERKGLTKFEIEIARSDPRWPENDLNWR